MSVHEFLNRQGQLPDGRFRGSSHAYLMARDVLGNMHNMRGGNDAQECVHFGTECDLAVRLFTAPFLMHVAENHGAVRMAKIQRAPRLDFRRKYA